MRLTRTAYTAAWTVTALAAVVGVALLSAQHQVLLAAAIERLREWGWFGIVAFAALFTVSALLLLPGAPLIFLAGLVYGTWVGFAVASASATLAAGAAFWMAHRLGGRWLALRSEERVTVAALLSAARDHGFWLVVLARLSPLVPFSALNVLMGPTGLRLRTFLLGSFIGKAPSVFAIVYAAELTTTRSACLAHGQCASTSPVADALFVVGIIATGYGTWRVFRLTRQYLRQADRGSIPRL